MSYFANIKKPGMIIIQICLCAVILSGCISPMAPKKAPESSQAKQEPMKIRNTMWDTRDLKPNHLALAEDLMTKKFYGVALVQLDQALEQDKNNSQIYNLKGVCARETNDLQNAEKFLKKALALDKKNASAHNNIAILYSMEKKPDLAEKSFNRALALDPARADFFNNAGVLYMGKKEYEKAKNCFSQAMLLEPSHENAINNLALTLGYLKKYDQAMKLLLNSRPYEIACHNMGCIYEMANQDEKAKKMFALANSKNITNGGQKPFDTQILNPETPLDTSPPTGMPGSAGNEIYERYQGKIKHGSGGE